MDILNGEMGIFSDLDSQWRTTGGGAKGALPPPEAPRGWQCPPLGNLDLE